MKTINLFINKNIIYHHKRTIDVKYHVSPVVAKDYYAVLSFKIGEYYYLQINDRDIKLKYKFVSEIGNNAGSFQDESGKLYTFKLVSDTYKFYENPHFFKTDVMGNYLVFGKGNKGIYITLNGKIGKI